MKMACLLVLLYIPTKFYQNMSKGIKVMERTMMHLRTDRGTLVLRADSLAIKTKLCHTTLLLIMLITSIKFCEIKKKIVSSSG